MDEQVLNETEKKSKKPYEKPQIVYRAPLEAMAGVCENTDAPTVCATGKTAAPCMLINS